MSLNLISDNGKENKGISLMHEIIECFHEINLEGHFEIVKRNDMHNQFNSIL